MGNPFYFQHQQDLVCSGLHRVVCQLPVGKLTWKPASSSNTSVRINSALLWSHTTQSRTGAQQTSASHSCSVFIVGWLGILIYIRLLLEFRPMGHLPGIALVTMAEGTKRDWRSVPPETSQVTSIHIFLPKPSPTVMPKFTWVRKYNSTRWSEGEEDQILVNKPNSATPISQPKKQCLHPSL